MQMIIGSHSNQGIGESHRVISRNETVFAVYQIRSLGAVEWISSGNRRHEMVEGVYHSKSDESRHRHHTSDPIGVGHGLTNKRAKISDVVVFSCCSFGDSLVWSRADQ